MNIFNLSTVEKANHGHEIKIKDFSGKDTGIRIKVYGEDSTEFKEQRHNFMQELRDNKIEMSRDDMAIKIATMLIISWENVEDANGELTCTAENCESVLRACPFIIEQINAASFDRTNFMKG